MKTKRPHGGGRGEGQTSHDHSTRPSSNDQISDSPLINIAEVASALHAIDPNCCDDEWRKIGKTLHCASASEEALQLWDDWSQRRNTYKPDECLRCWETFGRTRRRKTAINLLFRIASEHGWDGKISTAPDILRLVEIQRRRMLSDFCEQYGLAMIGGKAAVAYREFDRGVSRMTTRFSPPADIDKKHAPEKIPYVNKDKNGNTVIVQKSIVSIWMNLPIRKTYSQVVFKPIPGLVAGDSKLPDDDVLNLYQGLAIEPKEGDCGLILDHIMLILCRGDPHAYDYIMNWLARMFQNPSERGHVVIVLKSGEGTGKNIIIDIVVKAFGNHSVVVVKPEDLTGRFNDHLASSVLVFANEAVWGGNKQQEGALKSLITDEDLPVEQKYLPKFRVSNCCHLIMASNNDWVAPIGLDDRRFLVLDVSEERKGDHQYFADLAKHIENGGAEAFLDSLLKRNIEGFNPRILPTLVTAQSTKLDAKIRGADTVTQWWFHCLSMEEITYVREETQDGMYAERSIRRAVNLTQGWDTEEIEICCTELYDAYQHWAKKAHHRIEHITSFGAKLKAIANVKKSRPRTQDGNRSRVYVVQGLSQVRRAFEKFIKQEVPWED